MDEKLNILRKNKLFEGINENLEEVLSCLGTLEKSYLKDEVILLAGTPIKSLGIIIKGEIQILREDYMGNRTILTELNPGQIFGESFACAGLLESPVTVLAKKKSDIVFLGIHRIIATCSNNCPFHNKIIENLLKLLARKNILLNDKNQLLSQRSIRDKVMSYLSTNAQKKGTSTFEIPFTRNELADFLCVDRSALSRVLSQLQKEGVIHYHKDQFKILSV